MTSLEIVVWYLVTKPSKALPGASQHGLIALQQQPVHDNDNKMPLCRARPCKRNVLLPTLSSECCDTSSTAAQALPLPPDMMYSQRQKCLCLLPHPAAFWGPIPLRKSLLWSQDQANRSDPCIGCQGVLHTVVCINPPSAAVCSKDDPPPACGTIQDRYGKQESCLLP